MCDRKEQWLRTECWEKTVNGNWSPRINTHNQSPKGRVLRSFWSSSPTLENNNHIIYLSNSHHSSSHLTHKIKAVSQPIGKWLHPRLDWKRSHHPVNSHTVIGYKQQQHPQQVVQVAVTARYQWQTSGACGVKVPSEWLRHQVDRNFRLGHHHVASDEVIVIGTATASFVCIIRRQF